MLNIFKKKSKPEGDTQPGKPLESVPEPAAEGTQPAGATDTDDVVTLPLEKLIKSLPDSLKAFIAKIPPADTNVSFPVSRIMPQLAKGSIKVTFGELSAASPPATFQIVASQNDTLISLPLKDVLPQLGTAMKRKSTTQAPSLPPQDFFAAPAPSAPSAETPPVEATPDPAAEPPIFAPVTPAPPAKPAKPEPPAAPPGLAAFILTDILAGLTDDFKPLVAVPPPADVTVNLSIEKLVPQLAKGHVTVTLGELERAAPAGTFAKLAGKESATVKLSLPDVLARIGPEALQRKKPAKTLEGLEQRDFFGGSKTAPAQPGATTFVPKTDAEAVSETPETGFAPITPAPRTTFQPAAPSTESTVFIPAESAPPPAEPSAPTATGPADTVSVPVSKLADRWPEELKTKLARLPEATVINFPASELGHALKSGRVHFTWAQLRAWSKPHTTLNGGGHENEPLTIPLRAIVGPFMAAMRGKPEAEAAPPVAITAVTEEPSPPEEPAFPPMAPSATPPEPPEPAVSPAPAAPALSGISMTGQAALESAPVFVPPISAAASCGTSDTDVGLGDLLGQPDKTNWTPVEIVQRVAGLPAIAGAMLSLAEGQIAASDLSSTIEAPAVAMRIPRLFSTAGEEVRQMQLEPLSFFSFSTAGALWIVFKLGNIFFTVQGRPGEHLPISRLESIAVQIGKQCR